MSWTRTYRFALHFLPAALRRKHGSAMEALFARELQRAREQGRLDGVLAGTAGVWDVVRRGAYEQVRPGWGRNAAGQRHEDSPSEWWNIDAHGPQAAGANLGGPQMPQYTTRQLPRGGVWLVFGASFVVFAAYYMLMIAGEDLADRLVISPFVGMWWANALLLAAALLLIVSRRRAGVAPSGGEAVAVRG
jgi:hypothetical protein